MSRQLSVSRRELTSAQEVHRRYQLCMEDGEITPDEDAWIEEAHEQNMDDCDRTGAVIDLIDRALETAAHGRRFRETLRALELIHGGLADRGPEAA